MRLSKEEVIEQVKIGDEQLRLLEKLCNACAVSGDEAEVRAIVLEEVKPVSSDVKVDALGNVLVTCKASVENPLRVMLAAHMDEVGFMIVLDDGGGLYKFAKVGSVDERVLVGKPVLIGKEHVPAVIGAKPIHLTEEGETDRIIPMDALRMDVGPGTGVKVTSGDRATFATRFSRVGPSLVAKALDDRLGVASLIELVKHHPAEIELLAAFTVQEEIGGRGGRVAGYAFNPDLAIALDSTPAYDLPTWNNEENVVYNTHLGGGPAVYIADTGTLSDPRLVRHLTQTAEALGIPYQIRQPGGGGTDAGAIHRQRAGIPSISISVPGRYAHSGVMVARLEDWENALALVYAALAGLDPSVLKR
jgi:putative aminopeptidase FrvX